MYGTSLVTLYIYIYISYHWSKTKTHRQVPFLIFCTFVFVTTDNGGKEEEEVLEEEFKEDILVVPRNAFYAKRWLSYGIDDPLRSCDTLGY
jgi:hypothetical protein